MSWSKGSQQRPGFMNGDMGHRLREGIVPLHIMLLRAQLEMMSSLGPNTANAWRNWAGGGLRGPSLVVGLEHFFPEAEGAGLVQPRDRTDLEASN